MSEYDKLFTIEHLSSKGWQIIWSGNDLSEALRRYRHYLVNDYDGYRLTSPTDPSIYS